MVETAKKKRKDSKPVKKGKASVVDDDFFKLSDMEAFLKKSEREDEDKTDEESEEEDEANLEDSGNVMYDGFFGEKVNVFVFDVANLFLCSLGHD